MGKEYKLYKEETFRPEYDYPTCYVFEEWNGVRVADKSIDGLVKKCIERRGSDLRICRGDIITTLNAPQIMFPAETKTPARFMRVPVTNKELSDFYRRFMFELESQ